MKNYKFKQSAKRNKATAFLVTILFHAILLFGMVGGLASSDSVEKYLPDFVKEWIDDSDSSDNKDRA